MWVQRVAADSAPLAHRNLPHGGAELVAVSGRGVRLVGPSTGPTTEVLAPGTTVVGLRLQPAAAHAVLGPAAAELVDGAVDAEQLWGAAGGRLAEAADADPGAAADALQQAVLDRLRGAVPDPLVAEAVRRMLPGRATDVGAVGTALGISGRHLRRRCLDTTGLGPKQLQLILRFQGFLALAQHAIARGRAPADAGLAALAAQLGYTDQAHLSRDCLRLTGQPPGAFLAAVAPDCACGHDHAAAYGPLVAAITGRS